MLDLTQGEKQIILNALDVATKATGLNAAQVLLPVAIKLQNSMEAPSAVAPESD